MDNMIYHLRMPFRLSFRRVYEVLSDAKDLGEVPRGTKPDTRLL